MTEAEAIAIAKLFGYEVRLEEDGVFYMADDDSYSRLQTNHKRLNAYKNNPKLIPFIKDLCSKP